jgi:hypothetical protein
VDMDVDGVLQELEVGAHAEPTLWARAGRQ